jgi:hypothetical protein
LPDSLPPLPENLTAEQRGKIESAFKKAKRKELEFMCREFIEKK